MRVLVDAHMLGTRETGNETYVRNLLAALGDLDDVRVGAAVPSDGSGVTAAPHWETVGLHPSGDWMRLACALPRACREWNADILHVTYAGPPVCGCPVVASVHDVSFRRHPEFFSPRDRLFFATLVPSLLRRVDAVITLSEHARDEIIDWLPALAGRVHVTALAAGPQFRRLPDDGALERIRREFGIRNRYVLAVGNLQPRKNMERLVCAFASVHELHRDTQLVLVGKDQWRSASIRDTVDSLAARDAIILPGYVSDGDLVALYCGAEAFAYPSLYEGFGLPILEAMSCGAPVITSTVTSMPEVAGDAALLVDPYSVEAIADALLELLGSESRRRALREAGLKRAASYSWSQTARDTLKVYKSVLADRGRR